MKFGALALAQRALVLDSRANAPHLLRLALVTVMLVSVCSAFAARKTVGAPGLHLFEWLVYSNFAFVTLVGIAAFSAVIAEEKELGTLGLLQLAGFGGAAIVIGKSIGQLLGMALLLVVQVPFAFLAITLGGVAAHQILAAWLILLAYLLFVYALALLASVIASQTGRAARLGALALLAYHVVPWLGVSLPGSPTGSVGPLFWASRAAMDNTALSALTATTTTGFARPLLDRPVLVTLALAASLFLSALLSFQRCSRNEGQATSGRSWHRTTAARPRALRGEHAFFWKDFRFLCGGQRGMALRFAGYALLLLAGHGLAPHDVGILMAVITSVMALDLLVHANRMFSEELRSGTLPLLLLLLTPLGRIARAKARACAMLTVPPLAACGLVAFLLEDVQPFGLAVGLVTLMLALVPPLFLAVYLSMRLQRASLEVTIVATMLFGMLMTIPALCCATAPVSLVLLVASTSLSRAIGRLVRQRAAE